MPTIRLLFATTWLVAVKCRVSSKTVASICLRQLNLSQQSSSVLKSRLYLITTKTPAQITISRRRISRIVKRLTSQALQLPTRASLIQLLKRTPIYLIVTKEELLKRRKMVKMPLLLQQHVEVKIWLQTLGTVKLNYRAIEVVAKVALASRPQVSNNFQEILTQWAKRNKIRWSPLCERVRKLEQTTKRPQEYREALRPITCSIQNFHVKQIIRIKNKRYLSNRYAQFLSMQIIK